MSGHFVWVAMMWVMAACSLMVGGIDAFDGLRTSPVEMVLDPTISDVARKMLKAALDDENRIMSVIIVPVTYTFKDGKKITERDARLQPDELRSLFSGQTLSVYRNSGKPHAVYNQDELPNPWGWLILGFMLLGVALLASKLLKQELVD